MKKGAEIGAAFDLAEPRICRRLAVIRTMNSDRPTRWLTRQILSALVLCFIFLTPHSFAQQAPFPYRPLFQYGIFYNLDLEVDPGGPFLFFAPLFCNGGMWLGSSTVTYYSSVWAVGLINTNGADPFVAGKTDTGTPATNFVSSYPISGVAPVQHMYFGTNNLHRILDMPPTGAGAPLDVAYTTTNLAYTFNAASLIISNAFNGMNFGPRSPTGSCFTIYLQCPTGSPHWMQITNDFFIVTNWGSGFSGVLLTTNYVPGLIWTNGQPSLSANWVGGSPPRTNHILYAGFSFLTNVAYYDYRESATCQAVQIDVGFFRRWITNSSSNGGSNYNYNLTYKTGHGINSIYVYNNVPQMPGQLPAVRLVNGSLLPNSTNVIGGMAFNTFGLTVTTPQPLYVWGDYNVQIDGHVAVTGTTNTTFTYPAAFMADAITILSSNWSDGYNVSTNLASRPAGNTTVNAACVCGVVPSSGANYSGGLESSFRLLESWGGITLTYNGSIAGLFVSQHATNIWQQSGNYYMVPHRLWAFDTNFTVLAKLPALTPMMIDSNRAPVISVQPTNTVALVGETTNFNIAVAAGPTISYQWSLNGTNLSVATNASLLLSNIQLTNAGAYSVRATNVFGSLVSSNATLTVYTSAVPVMNAFTFSATNGAAFSITGIPGFNYTVLASTNMIDWQSIATNASPFNFNVPFLPAIPQQFYRAIYLP